MPTTAKLASSPPPNATGTVRYCSLCFAVYRTDFERCPLDGEPLVVGLTDPLIGRTLAELYVIESLIGEGAMGRVYRAHHRVLVNKRFAVKVLIGDLAASSQMRLRFAREAENASRLDHPNIVNITDFGQTEKGLHYLVMDLVEGTTLTQLIARGPLLIDRVIRIAHQLCEGLDHAHERGVIHRDFKSDNILVVGTPRRELVKIADFGLAMSTATDTRLTTTGVACTPAYAAPEQLRGGTIDHRVDLYGLGTVMFEMLSGGYLPFEGDLETSIRTKMSKDAPSIMTLAPNVPAGLVTLVTRLLAHEPDDRPRSARAVIKALETAMSLTQARAHTSQLPLASDPSLPPPLPPLPPLTTRFLPVPPRRRRGVVAGAALLVLACAGFFAWEHRTELAELEIDASQLEGIVGPVALTGEQDGNEPQGITLELPVAAGEPAAAVRIVATEPAPPPAVDEEPPAKTVDKARHAARKAARRVTRASSPRAVPTPAEIDRETVLDELDELTPAALARRYAAVGVRLQRLQAAQGIEITADLWAQYRRIHIHEAMATEESREDAGAVLDQLDVEIIARTE